VKSAGNMKEIMAKNLKLLLDRRGLSQTDMARDLNIPETTVSNWMKASTYPRIDKIQLVADYFDVRRSGLTEEKPTNLIEVSQKTVIIPILGHIACGDPILVEANFENYRRVLEEGLPTGELFYLQAKGDSMFPTIPDGSMVLIRHQNDVESGEIAVVTFNGNTEATLKRVKKQDDIIMLIPDNPKHIPIIVTQDKQVRIIGKVVRSEQDF